MKVSHDNNKMQTERWLKAGVKENKILQLDFDKAQTNEKKLNSMVASFEAQVSCSISSHFKFLKIHYFYVILLISLSTSPCLSCWPLLIRNCRHKMRLLVMERVHSH